MIDSDNPAAAPSFGADTDYDELPYLSLPIVYTQPTLLAALARLHGLTPANAERARILELGCANGGNLIALAARFPDCRFVGIDLSTRQIEDGRRRISHFGLANIELRQADLAQLDLPPDDFDFVICHGVWSWVPQNVHHAIFALLARCLRPDGVAAISYNVLPGWHLRRPIRDILLRTAKGDTPRERARHAREILAMLADGIGSNSAYAAVLHDEARRMRSMPASYLMGEFLAPENHPVTFTDFVEAARRQGLAFLCETDFSAPARAMVAGDVLRAIPTDAGREQAIDNFSGRPFRRSLLVKGGAAARMMKPSIARLAGLHLTAGLKRDESQDTKDAFDFRDEHGHDVGGTKNPAIARALAQLGAAFPGTASIDVLIGSGTDRDAVARGLARLILSGRAVCSTLPLSVGRATDDRPQVWPFARAEALLGQPYVTGHRHIAIRLPEDATALIAGIDGRRTTHAITADLAVARGIPVDAAAERVMTLLHHLEAGGALLPARDANSSTSDR